MVVIVENMDQRERSGWAASRAILVEEQNETVCCFFAVKQISSQKGAKGKAMLDIHFILDAPEEYWQYVGITTTMIIMSSMKG